MCTQGVCACVRLCVRGRRRVLTLNVCICALAQSRRCPERHRKLATTGCEPACFCISLSPRCLPEHNLSFTSRQKTNIKCTAFCSTSATVYLPGSRSLLFLHVPDIIIAVRRMIICLLWKLADCLSPVPEELPLKGVPLEKHHKSGFSGAQTHKRANRMTQDEDEGTAK